MNTEEDTTTDLSENKAKNNNNNINNTILINLKNLSKMNNFLGKNLSKQI